MSKRTFREQAEVELTAQLGLDELPFLGIDYDPDLLEHRMWLALVNEREAHLILCNKVLAGKSTVIAAPDTPVEPSSIRELRPGDIPAIKPVPVARYSNCLCPYDQPHAADCPLVIAQNISKVTGQALDNLGELVGLPPRSCNRHSDCNAADAEVLARTGQKPGFSFHCHSEDCEDCFGC